MPALISSPRSHIAFCATGWEPNRTASKPYDETALLDFVVGTVRTLRAPCIESGGAAGVPADCIPNDRALLRAGNAAMGEALAQTLFPRLNE